MISQISRLNKLEASNKTPAIINSSLPVIIKVLEKTGFKRYNLKFGNTNLSTRSELELDVGSEYFTNISSQSGGVIKINKLIKRDFVGQYLPEGIDLLEKILTSKELDWLLPFIKQSLANATNETEFKVYLKMLLALNEGVINIPFIYANKSALAQIKLGDKLGFFLVFDRFAPFIAYIGGGEFVNFITPYKSFANALQEAFGCKCEVGDVAPFWVKKKNFLDFKG